MDEQQLHVPLIRTDRVPATVQVLNLDIPDEDGGQVFCHNLEIPALIVGELWIDSHYRDVPCGSVESGYAIGVVFKCVFVPK